SRASTIRPMLCRQTRRPVKVIAAGRTEAGCAGAAESIRQSLPLGARWIALRCRAAMWRCFCYYRHMLREILSDRRLMRYLVLNVIVSVVSALIVMSLWTFFVFRDPPELTILSSAAGGGNSSPLRIAAVVAAGDLQNE